MNNICISLLFISLVFTPAIASSSDVSHWEGTLQFRGDTLQIRLQLDAAGPTARIDIPELVYAGEAAAIVKIDGGYTLTLPFGIGEIDLMLSGDSLTGEMSLAGDTLICSFTPTVAPPYRAEEISIHNGAIELRGSLLLPKSSGRLPAVIVVHGANTSERDVWGYRSWGDFYARQGFATLVYDKRGHGESTPLETEANLEDLEADLLKLIAYLRNRPEIDPSRIGLDGGSQGCWLVMMASQKDSAPAFLVMRSPGVSTPKEQELAQLQHGMLDDDMAAADICAALAYTELYFYVARSGQGWDLLMQAIEGAEGSAWLQYVQQPRKPADLAWWRANMDYAAGIWFRKIEVPTLALFGGNDWITPPAEYAGKLEFLARKNGSPSVEVEVLTGADHRLETPMGGVKPGPWRWPRVAAVEPIRKFLWDVKNR